MSKKLLLLLLCSWVFCACQRDALLHDLTENDANRLLTRLHALSIPATKEFQADGKWKVEVEAEFTQRALRIVQKERILALQQRKPSISPGLFSSRGVHEFAEERALSGVLEQTLLSVEGVIDARVHLYRAQRKRGQVLREIAPQDSSAAVLLVVTHDISENEHSLKSLIASASGVDPAQVTLIFNRISSEELSLKSVSALSLERESHEASESISVWMMHRGLIIQVVISLFLVLLAVRFFSGKRQKKNACVSEQDWNTYITQKASE